MADWFASAAIGFVSGVLSGMFGIGGGIVTTPAIRLLMGAPALVAVGTPLPVIIPSAVTGAASYLRVGRADARVGMIAGAAGAATAVAGAWATGLVGGPVVLIATAGLITIAAADMVLQIVRPPKKPNEVLSSGDTRHAPARRRTGRVAVIGLITGLYSGFFGLGGGFVLVPMLTRWLGFPIKRAIGTSLIAVSILAVPGTIAHSLRGNVDWVIVAGLSIGVVPGALLGAKLNAGARDNAVRLGFAVVLVVTAVFLAWREIAGLL